MNGIKLPQQMGSVWTFLYNFSISSVMILFQSTDDTFDNTLPVSSTVERA